MSGRSDHLSEHARHDTDTAAEIGNRHAFAKAGFEQDPAAGRRVDILQHMETTNRACARGERVRIRRNETSCDTMIVLGSLEIEVFRGAEGGCPACARQVGLRAPRPRLTDAGMPAMDTIPPHAMS